MQQGLSRRETILGLAGVISLSSAPLAFAHKLTTTDTRVDINTLTSKVEVIHVFHVHDTERALFKAQIIDGPDLISLRSRAQLALYVQKHFSLKNGEATLPLSIIGAEPERQNILVFQEGKLERPLTSLTVSASMMRGLVHNQINNVDVLVDGDITSLQFRGHDKSKKILA